MAAILPLTRRCLEVGKRQCFLPLLLQETKREFPHRQTGQRSLIAPAEVLDGTMDFDQLHAPPSGMIESLLAVCARFGVEVAMSTSCLSPQTKNTRRRR